MQSTESGLALGLVLWLGLGFRVSDPRWITSSTHRFGFVSLFFPPWCFIFVDFASLIGQGIDPIGFANLKRVHFHAPSGNHCLDMFAFPHFLRKLSKLEK